MCGPLLLLNPLWALVASLGAPPAPPLPAPTGPVTRVSDTAQLAQAIATVRDGETILIADGAYQVGRPLRLDEREGVTLRGASGDPTRVKLLGRGWDVGDQHDDILQIAHCQGITVADLTFADCRSYGIKVEAENNPRDIRIHNCRFRDLGVRAIKGSASKDCVALGGSVRYCDFANTRVPPADWLFDGDYISGIDMMALDGWTFSDNVFRDIKGRNGGGRAAIFLWVRSQRVVVERNVILNCDRGIAFGNPSPSTATNPEELHMTGAVCRNNAIVCGPDAGIELAWVRDVLVAHNTVWRAAGTGRGIRCIERISDTRLVNNLVRGEIMLSEGVTATSNLAGPLEGYFVDPAAGDLRLTDTAVEALGRATPLAEVTDDVEGRPRGGKPDLGAWQRP